jgi:dolichol kinase
MVSKVLRYHGFAGATGAYSQKIGHLFAERSATPGQPVDNLVIPVFTSL